MKTRSLIALTLMCLGLSACGTVGAGKNEYLAAAAAIASDPRCGHTDRIQGDIGGLGLGSGLHVFLERTCPPQSPPAN